MIQPRSLDATLGEYSEEFRAWAIQGRSGRYLTVPDVRFPGRRTIRFFTSEYDARRVLDAVLEVRPELDVHKLETVEVRLLDALRRSAAQKTPPRAESFTVHSPGEVYEFVKQIKQRVAAGR
jgi:2-methylcitrate dehydratase PrpD